VARELTDGEARAKRSEARWAGLTEGARSKALRRIRVEAVWDELLPEAERFVVGDSVEVEGRDLEVWQTEEVTEDFPGRESVRVVLVVRLREPTPAD